MRDPSLATLLMEQKCQSTGLLMEYKFCDFKLLEFARLINIVSMNQPNYQIDGSMCYWFASMVVAIAKAEFHGRLKGSKANSKLAGKNKGLPVYTANQNKINKIRSIYDEARCHDPEPLGPREVSNQCNIAEIRAKAEDLRLRELHMAEDLYSFSFFFKPTGSWVRQFTLSFLSFLLGYYFLDSHLLSS